MGEDRKVLGSTIVRANTIPRIGETLVIYSYAETQMQEVERLRGEKDAIDPYLFENGGKEALDTLIWFHNKYAGTYTVYDVLNPVVAHLGRSGNDCKEQSIDYQLTRDRIQITSFTERTMPKVRFLAAESTR